ncbi:unnamed protein product [Tilletia caries]|nr:unnamed protein product [Tilletia caries]CAD6954156.1 unnamed protein product [Tilletia caries]CAD6965001.1 unnamed protein product [Tilletia controversa]
MNTVQPGAQLVSPSAPSTDLPPPTVVNNSGPLDSSWNRVSQLSEDGPSTSTQSDTEWECEAEEELVTLDLSGFGHRLIRNGVECALIGLESSSPHLRIGDNIFRGDWTEPVGTDIHLNVEKDPSRPPHQQLVTRRSAVEPSFLCNNASHRSRNDYIAMESSTAATSASREPLQLELTLKVTRTLSQLNEVNNQLDISSDVQSQIDAAFQHTSKPINANASEMQPPYIIDHSVLANLSSCAQKAASVLQSHDIDPKQLTLYALTRGAKLHFPPKPKFERSAELEKSLAIIRLAHEQAEYERMSTIQQPHNKRRSLFNLTEPPRSHPTDSTYDTVPTLSVQKLTPEQEAEEWAEANKQISAVVNIIVSMGAVATAGWWAAGSASVIWKTLVCLALAIVVGVAETAMYARYWRVSAEQQVTRKAKMRGFDSGRAPAPLSFGQSRPSLK